jgi:O-antigen ligase
MTYLALICFAFMSALYGTGLKYVLHNRFALLIPDFAFTAVGLLLLARSIRQGRGVRKDTVPFLLAVLVYLTMGLLQIANPNVPSLVAGLEGFRKTCLYVCPALLGLYLNWSPRTATRFVRVLALCAVPVCIYGLKQFLAPSAFDFQIPEQNQAGEAVYNVFGAYRATSLLGSPFALGFLGNVVVAIALFLAGTGTAPIWVWVAAGSGVVAVVVSLTRVNILAALLVAVIGPTMILRAHGWVRRAAVAATLLLLAGVALSLSPVGDQVVRSLDLRYLDEDRAFGRFEGYSTGLEQLARNPLTGYGTGSAGDGLDTYFADSVYLPASHNVLLKVGFELGLVGLAAFLLLCIHWIRLAIIRYRQGQSREEKAFVGLAGCVFLIFAFQGASGSGIDTFPANAITFFLMGLVAGMEAPCLRT